jgi:hypothetical protein
VHSTQSYDPWSRLVNGFNIYMGLAYTLVGLVFVHCSIVLVIVDCLVFDLLFLMASASVKCQRLDTDERRK